MSTPSRSSAGRVRVLVVDDQPQIRSLLQDFLLDYLPGGVVDVCGSAGEARERLAAAPYDILFNDLGLPDEDGRDLVPELVELYHDMTIIVITGSTNIADAVDMFRRGAYDFLTKPIDLDYMSRVVDRAVERLQLEQENQRLRQHVSRAQSLPGMVGASAQLTEVARQVHLIAPRDTTILVLGESGTGKELVAKAIHAGSPRKDGPFVALNVAAVPETLLEAECFGYGKNSGVSGAPPGGRAGIFERANGGTLFLDEIGDMPLSAQAKILRALQEKEIVRIGGIEPIPLDSRVVCATHHDLQQSVEAGNFREDLFYRLNSFPIYIPPLRSRREDIAVMAQHFLREFSDKEGQGADSRLFASDAISMLQGMTWKGNARELRSLVERAAITTTGEIIRAADLVKVIEGMGGARNSGAGAGGSATAVPAGPVPPYKTASEEFEFEYLGQLLAETHWNVSHAAEQAGLSRTYLHRMMRKHGIKRP